MDDNTAYWIEKIHVMYIPGRGPTPKRITVCSNCNGLAVNYTNYCPECGKRMIGYKDERPQEYRKGSRFI